MGRKRGCKLVRLVCARLPNTQVFARTLELANYLIGYAVLPFWIRFVRAEENISNDDFSNDLFTDLAPLLNLFGEEVSKQFMSQSLGWADDIIFAMCPLGIITSIVSAVRAAGSPSLKAFIGRAREPRGSVEVEIFSSTSHDVCEIYGEEGIERVQSSSAVEQLLYFDPDPSDIQEESADTLPDIFDMDTAVQRRILKADPKSASPEVGIQPEVHKHPNILLNFNSSSSSTGRDTELWMVAVLSVVLQLAVLVFGALATYVWKWTKRGISVGSFAFPITAAGTLSVCVGLTLCSRIVEASTTETYWKINPEITKGRRLQIVWLQKARLIHGTNIQSLAIFASEDQQKNGLRCLRTSQRNLRLEESPHDDDKELNKRYNNIYEPLVPIATFLTMAGYLLQLIGLREMHSSVALVQLAGTLLMAGMRVWVRRRLEERPITVPIFTGHEYDRLSLRIARCKEWVVRTGFEHKSMDIESPDQEKVASLSVSALPVWPQDISAVSAAVTKTITKTLQILDPLVDTSELSFDLAIDFILKRHNAPRMPKMSIQLELDIDEPDLSQRISAILSLWLYHSEKQKLKQKEREKTEHHSAGDKGNRFFCVGKATPESYLLCLKWIIRDYKLWRSIAPPEGGRPTDPPWFDLKKLPRSATVNCTGNAHLDLVDMTRIDTISKKGDISNCIAYQYPNQRTKSQILGQHLFAIFMYSVAKVLGGIRGTTMLRKEASNEARPIIENSVLEEIADCFVKNELGTKEEAYTCIIPSLAAENKLPNLLSNSDERLDEPTCGLDNLLEVYPNNKDILYGLLGLALKKRDEDVVKTMLAFQTKNDINPTVLQMAAWDGKVDIVEVVLGLLWADERLKGPRVSSEISSQQTSESRKELGGREGKELEFQVANKNKALNLAAEAGHSKVVQLLLENGASVSASDGNGNSALHLAARNGRYETVLVLLNRGAEVSAMGTIEGNTPLHLAARNGQAKVISLLLLHSADVAAINRYAQTPLHLAAESGSKEAVALLLEATANVSAHDNVYGDTPLHIAAKNGYREIAELLLTHHADVATRNNYENTPLIIAARRGNEEIVDLLLTAKATVSAKNKAGFTALHYAAVRGWDIIVAKLLDLGLSIDDLDSALLWAVEKNRPDIVRSLIDRGAEVSYEDEDGYTPLHFAAISGYAQIVEILVQNDANVNGSSRARSTPLTLAARMGYANVVKYLLDHNADLTLRDGDGDTALHCAAYGGSEEIVTQLLRSGADPWAKNYNGKLAADYARQEGHESIRSVLEHQPIITFD